MPTRPCQLSLSSFHGRSGAPSTPANLMPPITGIPTRADTGLTIVGSNA